MDGCATPDPEAGSKIKMIQQDVNWVSTFKTHTRTKKGKSNCRTLTKDEVVEGSELKAACFLELVPSPLFCLRKGNHDLVLLDPD